MSTHLATTHWQRREGEAFTDNRYARRHEWHFDGGAVVAGSSAPTSVPLPWSDPTAVDPEEAFVAALSSCHLLWFLHLAGQAGWVVDHYRDEASGTMARNARGKIAFTQVTLRPTVRFAGAAPTAEEHEALHHRAHEECFIANSVACAVHCHPTIAS
jgi:organic hydroperoxide reductase OsmC/OhrA